MGELLKIARSTSSQTDRAIALRGYLRMATLSDKRGPQQTLALYREAAAVSSGPEEKRLILAGLGKVRSLGALEYAASMLSDASVRGEAELAVVEIARTTAGAFPDKTKSLLQPIATGSSNEATKSKARDILSLMGRFGDYVVAWEVSPAYERAGIEFSRLFDMAFPPEEAAAKDVPWRLMPAGGGPEQPWLMDLLAALGGEQRVAYLRTSVWCDGPRELTLEMGSDDGIKAWWNGSVILARNTARAAAPGQERVKVQAKAGWNQLMLKITQNNQGWGAVARITNGDGTPASGLRFAVPSVADKTAGR